MAKLNDQHRVNHVTHQDSANQYFDNGDRYALNQLLHAMWIYTCRINQGLSSTRWGIQDDHSDCNFWQLLFLTAKFAVGCIKCINSYGDKYSISNIIKDHESRTNVTIQILNPLVRKLIVMEEMIKTIRLYTTQYHSNGSTSKYNTSNDKNAKFDTNFNT